MFQIKNPVRVYSDVKIGIPRKPAKQTKQHVSGTQALEKLHKY